MIEIVLLLCWYMAQKNMDDIQWLFPSPVEKFSLPFWSLFSRWDIDGTTTFKIRIPSALLSKQKPLWSIRCWRWIPLKNYGRGRVRWKHLYWERIVNYHHFGNDFRFLLRESIGSMTKNRSFRIVDSPGKSIVNPLVWRCRDFFPICSVLNLV